MTKSRTMTKPANRTFFFGYGSLMYPHGINRRGMKKVYNWSDLKTASLRGFERSFCANAFGYRYYGVKVNEASSINGTVFEVLDDYDYTMLMISEGAHTLMHEKTRVYQLLEVTDKISQVELPAGARVFIVIPIWPTTEGLLNISYLKMVWESIQPWGKEFAAEFLRTGGRKYDTSAIEENILYMRKQEEERKLLWRKPRRNSVEKRNTSNATDPGRKRKIRSA